MSLSTTAEQTSEFASGGLEGALAQHATKRWSRKVAAEIVGILDVVTVVLGSILPAAIYFYAGGVVTNWQMIVQSALVAGFITHILLRNWGHYDTQNMHNFPTRPGGLLAALLLAIGGFAGLGLPPVIKDIHMWVWCAVWIAASYTMILGHRGITHYVLAKLTAAGRFDERVAVFGAGQIARRVHDYLSDPALGIRFVGVFDDRAGQDRLNPEGLTVAGRLDDLLKAARKDQVDKIVIALPQAADRRIIDVAKKLTQLPVSVHIVTHIASDLVDKIGAHEVSNIGSVGLIDVKSKPLSDWGPILKRTEDLVLGTALLIITAPLFPIIAVAVKLTSKGPVFFRQCRGGLNQHVFQVWKFRSMTVTENGNDVVQAKAADPRVTPVGRFLRRWSLDELPQIFNVLKGDMALVGPRPHAVIHDEKFGGMIETYSHRAQVKPGITGLAQIKGYRGPTTEPRSIEARVEEDLAYIKSWSLGLDLMIVSRTVWAVIIGRNAT